MECHEDALFLKPFVDLLKSINITLDTIDTYCVYTRLKIFDNSEVISVNYLEYELKNLENGNEILDSNTSNNYNANNDTNNKFVDVKVEEGKNDKNKKTNNLEKNNANNIKISIDNEANTGENKNYKDQIALIETDSEKESLEEFEDSDSKLDSSSNNENKQNCIYLIYLLFIFYKFYS